MKITRDISVFALDSQQVDELTRTRLYPQDDDRGRWGCASLTGFLAQGQSLMAVARADQKTLRDRSIDYSTIAKRLWEITNAAIRALGKPSETPVLVENGKFEVTVYGPAMCAQFCPFSPEDDSKASPFNQFDHECPSATNDYIIRNTSNNRSIRFGGLLPHLIGIHNFFLGNVPHRLDPLDVIETLELSPESGPCSPPAQPKSTELPHQPVFPIKVTKLPPETAPCPQFVQPEFTELPQQPVLPKKRGCCRSLLESIRDYFSTLMAKVLLWLKRFPSYPTTKSPET